MLYHDEFCRFRGFFSFFTFSLSAMLGIGRLSLEQGNYSQDKTRVNWADGSAVDEDGSAGRCLIMRCSSCVNDTSKILYHSGNCLSVIGCNYTAIFELFRG